MAFDATYLHLAREHGGTVGCKEWIYDTLDATGTVDGTGYFAGMGAGAATSKGMEIGDKVLVRIWTTAIPTTTAEKLAATIADAGTHLVIAATAAGACTVSAETAIVVAAGA